MNEKPYIVKRKTYTVRFFNPAYSGPTECQCGHDYHRHFDPYEDYAAVGCKYCGIDCLVFKPKKDTTK